MSSATLALVAGVLCISYVAAQSSTNDLAGTEWSVPTSWQKDKDYVVVRTAQQKASNYGGYIFPGPDPQAVAKISIQYVSPDGFYCESKHYDANYGIFQTQECANIWTSLITQGDNAPQGMPSSCLTVATRPCGCQQVCRPVDCSPDKIKSALTGTFSDCQFYDQCRLQEERGLVTSCAHQSAFQILMWFGIIFAVIIAFAAYSMMNMSLDMDSLLYTVGEPDKKDN